MEEALYNIEDQSLLKVDSLSTSKFIILSLVTFGLYEFWWIYKAWRFFREKENGEFNAALKTIFSIIYLIPLFNKIQAYSRDFGYPNFYSSTLLYFGILTFSILGYLPDPFLLISLLSVMFFIKPFKALNFAMKEDSSCNFEMKSQFNRRQIVLIVLGCIWWFLVILEYTL